jgi:hypothetical protein
MLLEYNGRRVSTHQIHSQKYFLGTVTLLGSPEGAALTAHANVAHVAVETARLRLKVQGFIIPEFDNRQ